MTIPTKTSAEESLVKFPDGSSATITLTTYTLTTPNHIAIHDLVGKLNAAPVQCDDRIAPAESLLVSDARTTDFSGYRLRVRLTHRLGGWNRIHKPDGIRERVVDSKGGGIYELADFGPLTDSIFAGGEVS